MWLAVVAWPFAVGRLQGAAAEHAAKVNKALVAFIACRDGRRRRRYRLATNLVARSR